MDSVPTQQRRWGVTPIPLCCVVFLVASPFSARFCPPPHPCLVPPPPPRLAPSPSPAPPQLTPRRRHQLLTLHLSSSSLPAAAVAAFVVVVIASCCCCCIFCRRRRCQLLLPCSLLSRPGWRALACRCAITPVVGIEVSGWKGREIDENELQQMS